MDLRTVEIRDLFERVAEPVEDQQAPPARQMQPAIMILRLDCLKRCRIGDPGTRKQAVRCDDG